MNDRRSISHRTNRCKFSVPLLVAISVLAYCAAEPAEPGFTSLFDGKSLDGWAYVGEGPPYVAKDGVLVCPKESSGNLFSKKEYADFVLRLDYKLEPDGNNGVGIRCPFGATDDPMAYSGMEIQILDDKAPKHAEIKPWQFNGSVYNIV